MVGTLLYIAQVTRPDITYAATMLARHMYAPSRALLKLAQKCLLYLKGTAGLRLVFGGSRTFRPAGLASPASGQIPLVLYTDSDWAACPIDRRSVSGFVATVDGAPVIWGTKKQSCVAKSTMAAEYISASTATDDVIGLLKLLEVDMRAIARPVPLLCDNIATTKVLVNPVESSKMKYIEIHYHVVRERVAAGIFHVQLVTTHEQLADCFTKPLAAPKLQEDRRRLCLR